VIFRLRSAEVVIGFNVPGFAERKTIIPREVAGLPMVPTKLGEFTYLCGVFCSSRYEGRFFSRAVSRDFAARQST
jgi:heme/copper-type cytochrome/quinol oxidase subunit 2